MAGAAGAAANVIRSLYVVFYHKVRDILWIGQLSLLY